MHRSFFAPIVLFVFSRPDHTSRTIEALAANLLADQSDLIVYADGARNDSEVGKVNQVRDLARAAKGFRSVTLIERDTNYGLARNIIEGVSDVCKRYGKVIVLEDDLLTSQNFLTFMNVALDHYESDSGVWHISGWNYPIDPAGLGDAFFIRVMNCWGWATWANRWDYYEKNTDKLIAEFDQPMIKDFDLDSAGGFWNQVLLNHSRSINTWAIYWYATIFKHGGLCLNPALSHVQNIGVDGSGTHRVDSRGAYSTALTKHISTDLPLEIIENESALQRIKDFYIRSKPTLLQRVTRKLSTLMNRKRGE